MVWSKWKNLAVFAGLSGAGLVGAGVVYSQHSPPRPSPSVVAADPSQIVKIEEPGKPGQAATKCRVIAHWHTAEGQQAWQMQILDTSQMLTIVEVGQPPSESDAPAKAIATRIFHWGNSLTPPPGAPAAPMLAVAPMP